MRLLFQVLLILLIFVLVVVVLYIADIKKDENEAKERLENDFQRDSVWENAQKEMKMREEIKKATAQVYKPQETPLVPNQDIFTRKDPEAKLPNEKQLPFKMPYFQNLGGIEKFASQSRKENTPHFNEFAGFKRGTMSLSEDKFGANDNQDFAVYSRGGRAGPKPIKPRRTLAEMFGYDTGIGPTMMESTENKKEMENTPKTDNNKSKKTSGKSKAHSKTKSIPTQHMDALSQLRSEEFPSMSRR